MVDTNMKGPDYFEISELLTDEQKLIRDAVREWVNRMVMPDIENYFRKHEFPYHLIKDMGELGGFGPTIPEKYGGLGFDHISYGLIMQELERGDSLRPAVYRAGSTGLYPSAHRP